MEKTKQVLRENKVAKFLAIGGGVTALTHNFITVPFMGIVEFGGQVGGAMLINKVIKGSKPIEEQSKKEVYTHIAKSGFLLLGGLGVQAAGLILPLDHVTRYAASTLYTASGLGVIEGSVALFKRRNKSVALEQAKENNTSSLFSNNKSVEHSDQYVGMRNKGFHATEEETEEAALSLTKTFKKR